MRLTVDIYRNSFGGSSNGGISSVHNEAILTNERVLPEEIKASGLPIIQVVKRYGLGVNGGIYVHAEPVRSGCAIEKSIGPMAGGTFVFTSDSRYREITGVDYPISLHDRWETPEQYEALST